MDVSVDSLVDLVLDIGDDSMEQPNDVAPPDAG